MGRGLYQPKDGLSSSVSILMPARDAARHMLHALSSIRAQSYENLEVVLVDDGCTDDTLAIAREEWSWDTRPMQIVTAGGEGLARALAIGLDRCRGQLVARMDADDISHPERVIRQVSLLESRPDVDLVSCRTEIFSDHSIGDGYQRYQKWQNSLLSHAEMERDAFVESPVAHPSVMFRKQRILGVGGYRECGWPEDYDLWLRCLGAGLILHKLPEFLLRFRDHPDRASRRSAHYGRDAFMRCKAHHLARGPLRDVSEVVIWGLGRNGRRLSRYLAREGVRSAAFVEVDRRKIGRSRNGSPIIAPAELPDWTGRFLIAAVGAHGARDEIRRFSTKSRLAGGPGLHLCGVTSDPRALASESKLRHRYIETHLVASK